MASPWTSYDFDPEAGDGQGAYTFSDGKSTRTVANTAFAAQLAADIDAAAGKSRSLPTTAAAPFGGAAPPPDPMAGMARAEQAAAARVAPEWQPAQAALTGGAPMPDPMAGMAAVERVLAARGAPAPRPDPGAGLAPEAAQAARAIGTAPTRVDMDALARRLEAIGKRPEPAAVTAAPAVGLAAPDDRMAMETGYRKRGPFDFRRFLVDGPPQPLASMPEPLASQAPPVAPVAAAPSPAERVGTTTLYDPVTNAPRGTAAPAGAEPAARMGTTTLYDAATGQARGTAAPASVDPSVEQSAQASREYQATATAAQMAKPEPPPAPSAVRVGGPRQPDETERLIDARGAEALGFQDRQNAIEQDKASTLAGVEAERGGRMAENVDELATLRESQQRAERALLGERNAAAEEVFAKQYDPDRFWKQRPAAGLLATIAVALGELGRGLQRSNGPNIGLTLVNQAIERDLDAQREEYGRAKDKLGIKNSAYAELRAKGLTDQQAMAAAHAQQLSLVDQRIKMITANSDDAQMKLRGDMLRAGIQNDTVDKKREYRAKVEREAAQRAQAEAAMREKQRKDRIKEAMDLAQLEHVQSQTRKNNADASGDNHLNTETRELGSALAPIIDAREQAAPLLQALAQLPEGEELPGYTMGANAVSMANSVVPFVNTRRALSDESNKNRNMVNQAFMGYRHAMTGAGGSDQEMKFLEETWKGAGTTAELRDAVQRSEAVLTNVERRRRAAFSERANATFDARGGAQTTTPIRSLRKVGP